MNLLLTQMDILFMVLLPRHPKDLENISLFTQLVCKQIYVFHEEDLLALRFPLSLSLSLFLSWFPEKIDYFHHLSSDVTRAPLWELDAESASESCLPSSSYLHHLEARPLRAQ